MERSRHGQTFTFFTKSENAAECRARAKACRKSAAASRTRKLRLLALAKQWEVLAKRYDALDALKADYLLAKLSDNSPRH
jgi:hypothetical protein